MSAGRRGPRRPYRREEAPIELRARATATFPALSTTPALARGLLRDTFASWALTEATDDVLLLTTELVTNAVVHAGTDVDVIVEATEDAVIVSVTDRYSARSLPAVATPPPDTSEGGRGLWLVQTIAARWGVEHWPTGKRVWFEVAVPGGIVPAERRVKAAAMPTVAPGRVLVAVVAADRAGLVTGWGGDSELMFGWAEEEIVGRPLSDVLAQEGGRVALVEQLAAAESWHGHVAVRTADGPITTCYASHRLATTDGSLLCLWTATETGWALRPLTRTPSGSAAGLAGILGLADAVVARMSLDDLLAQVLRRLCVALRGDAAYVLLCDEGEKSQLRAAYGFDVDEHAELKGRSMDGIAGRLGEHNLPLILEDLTGQDGDPLLSAQGLRCAVAAPLVVEGKMIGSLHVAARRVSAFETDDGVRLAQVSDRIALAVERARLSELDRRRRGWLAYVAEASDLLAGTLELDRTLALVAQLVVPALGEWCAIHLLQEGGESTLDYMWHADEARGDDVRAALRTLPAPERRTQATQTPPNRRQPWRPPADDALSEYDRLVYPLVARNNVLGSLTVGRSIASRYQDDEIDLAEDLARRAALAIDNARQFQQRVEVVTALQRSLLPPEAPVITGCEIGVAYLAAGGGSDVGGDFYDVFQIDNVRWGVAIGDVCGKGPEAAAVTGLARHTIRILGRDGRDVTSVLERLNLAILDEGPRARFVTVAYAVVEPIPGGALVEICSAGHPLPMLLAADGTVCAVGEPQSLLGVLADPGLRSQRLQISAGDALVFFTDGVTERREGDRMLGEEGLAKLLRSCAPMPAGAIAARIERAVVDFQPHPPRDDMAVVVIRVL
ncbi:MAG: SpoIIE family protein phosphatase [Mycobacteriales bacterium]